MISSNLLRIVLPKNVRHYWGVMLSEWKDRRKEKAEKALGKKLTETRNLNKASRELIQMFFEIKNQNIKGYLKALQNLRITIHKLFG